MKLAALNSSSAPLGGLFFITSNDCGFRTKNMLTGDFDSDIVSYFKGNYTICDSGYLTMQATGGHYTVTLFQV